MGLFLRDLGGPFEEMKDAPILSGIFTDEGLKRLDAFMMNLGFMTKYKLSIKVPKAPPPGVPKRDIYLIRAYEYPEEWDALAEAEKHRKLVHLRLKLRQMGEDMRCYYVLAYTAKNQRSDGQFRKLSVKVRRKGLDVRTRRGYLAVLPERLTRSSSLP